MFIDPQLLINTMKLDVELQLKYLQNLGLLPNTVGYGSLPKKNNITKSGLTCIIRGKHDKI